MKPGEAQVHTALCTRDTALSAAAPSPTLFAVQRGDDEMSDERPLPGHVSTATQMLYRSSGLGVWGAILRFGGMPLEKIAL